MTTLENRYRRLLAIYPRQHRLMYEEEMIGVLLADAEPGRQRPSIAEYFDLALSAAAVRLRRLRGGPADDAWRRAAYTALLAGSIALLAIGAHRLADDIAAGVHYHALGFPAFGGWLRPGLWALVVTAALIRLRRTTALLALVALAAEVVRIAAWYSWSPSQVLQSCWLLTGAVVVAAIAVWLVAGEAPSRPRGLWLLAVAGAAVVVIGIVETVQPEPSDGATFSMFSVFGRDYLLRVSLWLVLVPVVAVAWSWWQQPAVERLRVLVFGVPVLTMAVLVPYGYGGFMYSSQRRVDQPNYLVWFQWVLLVLVPLLAFAIAILAVNRYERIQRLIELGRAAEQREVAPGR